MGAVMGGVCKPGICNKCKKAPRVNNSTLCQVCGRAKRKRYYRKHAKKLRADSLKRNGSPRGLKLAKKWRVKNALRSIIMNIKSTCKRFGIPFDLTVDDIAMPKVCPYLGIPLKMRDGEARTDNTMSIDRVDPDEGYVRGNIIVVSWRANRLKNDAKLWELKAIVAGIENFLREFDAMPDGEPEELEHDTRHGDASTLRRYDCG